MGDYDKVTHNKGSIQAIALNIAHDAGKARDGYGAVVALTRLVKWLTHEDHRLCIGSVFQKGQEATPAPAALTPEILDGILVEAVGGVARAVQDAIGEAYGDAAGLYFSGGDGEERGEHGALRAIIRRFAVWHAEDNGIDVSLVRGEGRVA